MIKRNIHIMVLMLVTAVMLLMRQAAISQTAEPFRNKVLVITTDTLKLDTLSIIPGTFRLLDSSGNLISYHYYTLIPARSLLICGDSLKTHFPLHATAVFKVYPYNFSKEYFHKEKPPDVPPDIENPFSYRYTPSSSRNDFLDFGTLSKSGSITRGISFGNNQDMSISSGMNIQLAGKIGEDIDLLAAISDNNMPIQPEGNTAQIQEFDKVFIQLTRQHTQLIAGDFELGKPPGYFLNLNKKALGAHLKTRVPVSETDTAKTMSIAAAAAISKGKFARNPIQGMEGNQGPYKLTGSDNEQFIIVLAGTEKVYLDGKLLERGQDNDYVIDYNMAEVRFTPKNMITKDKRIVVEFEYSDKKYARSLLFASTAYATENLDITLNWVMEQDIKTQPLAQTLDDDRREILRLAGDSLQNAWYTSIDSLGFTQDEIRYKLIDTLGYDSILIYSTHPDSAHYRAQFSLTGQGNGNYIIDRNAANGRVFKWVAPINGAKQGSYEPVMTLFAPARKQMVNLAVGAKLGKTTRIETEIALSQNDINTFSALDASDNNGVAYRIKLSDRRNVGKDSTWTFTNQLIQEFTQSNFRYFEPYRAVEFNRDWNLSGSVPAQEIISSVVSGIQHSKAGKAEYRLSQMQREKAYSAWQHHFDYNFRIKPLQSDAAFLLTRSRTPAHQAGFFRHHLSVSVPIKRFTAGILTDGEQNRFTSLTGDSLLGNSFSWVENSLFAGYGNEETNSLRLKAGKRFDKGVQNGGLKEASVATNLSAVSGIKLGKRSRMNLEARYRRLQISDSTLSTNKPDQTATGRIELIARNNSGSLVSNTFYEAGSGLEARREFSYIEVAPGQGAYAWTDYNGDGIQQLNEFEIAAFQDQANFIRVYFQSNDYIKTYINQFSQTLNISPGAVWANKGGWRGFLARFSNQSAVRLEQKTAAQDILQAFNPIPGKDTDTNLIYLNSNLRNALFFNRTHPVWGMEYSVSDNRNRNLLTNGFESRSLQQHSVRGRFTLKRVLTSDVQYSNSKKGSNNQFFQNRNYLVNAHELSPTLSWQPSNEYRISLNARYSEKTNLEPQLPQAEKALVNLYSLEARYNSLNKGNFTARISAINIRYNATENTPLAYEMLEALRSGQNFTWNAGVQYTFSGNLQLNLMYDGRKSPATPAVHTGNVQLRAFF